MKIVIIGGVAGGATAAARLRRISETADIVLVERGPYISFANCGLPYHISGVIAERDKLLVTREPMFEARYRVDVRSGTEALAIDRAARTVRLRNLETGVETDEPYDRLLLTPGAEPVRPRIAGAELEARLHPAQHPRPRSHHGGPRRSATAAGGGDRRRVHRSRGRREFS